MTRLGYFSKLRKGVTLLELLIAIFIFSIVLIIISSSLVQGFVTGRLYSSATKEENTELNAVTALIAQKMTSANTKFILPDIDHTPIYGFNHSPRGVNALAIASTIPPAVQKCTFFGLKTSDKAIYMKEANCSTFISESTFNVNYVGTTGWQRVTTGITKITRFNLAGQSFDPVSPTIAPWVTVSITGQDTRTNAVVTLEQTYSLNYPYEQNW